MRVYEPMKEVPYITVLDFREGRELMKTPRAAPMHVAVRAGTQCFHVIQLLMKLQHISPTTAPKVSPIKIDPIMTNLRRIRPTMIPTSTEMPTQGQKPRELLSIYSSASREKALTTIALNPPKRPQMYLNQTVPAKAGAIPMTRRKPPKRYGFEKMSSLRG